MSSSTFTLPKTFRWSCGSIIVFKKIDKVSVNDLHLPDFHPNGYILYMYLNLPFQH
jgi:hypothetical protein